MQTMRPSSTQTANAQPPTPAPAGQRARTARSPDSAPRCNADRAVSRLALALQRSHRLALLQRIGAPRRALSVEFCPEPFYRALLRVDDRLLLVGAPSERIALPRQLLHLQRRFIPQALEVVHPRLSLDHNGTFNGVARNREYSLVVQVFRIRSETEDQRSIRRRDRLMRGLRLSRGCQVNARYQTSVEESIDRHTPFQI
jgi:hypothetical protein